MNFFPGWAGGKRVMRLKPRFHPDVNKWWMCDVGRYGYHAIDDNRLLQPQVREQGTLRSATWDEAMARVTEAISRLKAAGHLDRVGVVLSTDMTNEELYLAKRLYAALGIDQVTVRGPRPTQGDQVLLQADRSPNTRGAQALSLPFESDALLTSAMNHECSVLIVHDHDLVKLCGEAQAKALSSLDLLVFVGSNMHGSLDLAHVVLPGAVYAEKDGTLTNVQGRVQRINAAFPPIGEARPALAILFDVGKRLGVELPAAIADTVFQEMAAHEKAFHGLSYEVLGDCGAMLNGAA